LYGEFFGHHEIFGIQLQPINIAGFVLYKPLENILSVFKFAILIGVIQINLGWFLQMMNYWRNKRKFMAFADSFLKILLLSGGTFLLFGFGFRFESWLKPPFPILLPLIPGVLLLVSKVIGRALGVNYLKHESYGELFGEGFMETFETFLAILSNVASYVRILALALAHISLMMMLEPIQELDLGWGPLTEVMKFIFIILGNFIIILFEGLLVIINDIRLHFYEFFFKFFQGKGIEYNPFNLNNKFSIIIFMADESRDIIMEELEREIKKQSGNTAIQEAIQEITNKYM
jgi:V/A-type H+-transporting ATPase subunit I